jgi:ribosomal protein S18 acetylase RimI-like enzyme
MVNRQSSIVNGEIRPFSMNEYEAVIALWKICEGVGLSSADEPARIEAYLARNPGMSFIARDGEKVIGAVLCGHDGRRGYIHHMAVHPDHRRQGIGQQLVDLCLAALLAAGIDKCHLFIFTSNQPGIAFWQNGGWQYRTDIAVMSRMVASSG